jgi:hypothetical protein
MSALGGGLKRSTQHFISDARDGMDGRWVEDMFEGSTRAKEQLWNPLALRIRSSPEWLGNSMNGGVRLWLRNPSQTRFNESVASTD